MKEFRFKRICQRCNELYRPIGKHQTICEKCLKPRGRQFKRIRKVDEGKGGEKNG